MNKYQYRCIKESLIRDKYLTNLLLEPIMGKTIDDIKFKFKDFEEAMEARKHAELELLGYIIDIDR